MGHQRHFCFRRDCLEDYDFGQDRLAGVRVQRYRNFSGTSGVRAFELGPDFIRIQYVTGGTYLYTYDSAGAENIERMKELALKGSHLNDLINRTPAIKNGFVK